ncbi:hypothetical protein [Streptomyces tubercidicus]|uniref:hypothetical protein n=1 Tax=Streptomyces tubercidicus TaxID=47759 RepID=UPI002E104B73|nr:FeoC-like transcriptional regulator [Streptomyces tubercidicus]
MQSHRALAVLGELRSLAAHDATRLTQAKDHLVRAEAELAAARAAFDSASTRAEVSQRVVCGAEELLPPVAGNRGPTTDGARAAAGSAGRRTIAQEVLAFLRPGHRASRAEITRHFEVKRPDIKPSSLWRELSRMVTKGKLISVARGVYATAPSAAGGDA